MSEATKGLEGGFKIEVSEDRLTATVVIAAGASVSAAQIIPALREMKLAAFDDGAIIEALEARKAEAISIVAAKGKPAVDEQPRRIEYRVPVADEINCTIAKLEAGKVVATLSASVPGTDGVDVFGLPIAHKKGEMCTIGRNLSLAKDEITATAGGNFRLCKNTLSVEPLLELRDDRNPAPVQFDGDVLVKGSLGEGRILEISGSLTVGGAIEAVQLKTGGAVNVKGGVIGKTKGHYLIGGDLRCRFISGGLLVASSNVYVQSEVIHSHIVCSGRLTVSRGAISGGDIAAIGGISCSVLGHPNGAPTVVEAGSGRAFRTHAASIAKQIEANRKRIEDVRAKIEPLMRRPKLLNAQQKERATELLYEAGELEERTIQMAKDLEDQRSRVSADECPEILVSDVAHPGVTVRLGITQTVISMALKGPFKLATRKLAAITEIVLIDQTDQSVTALPSHLVPPEDARKTGATAKQAAA
jgi:uncharacterized protein (DUF342 family)